MIHELLRPEKIHLDVRRPLDQVLRRMVAELPHGEHLLQSLEPLIEEPDTLLLMPSDEVVLPHFPDGRFGEASADTGDLA
jgi:hypothetical protein